MSRQRAKGTAAESAVVDYLKPLFPYVERRVGNGTRDRGDLTGIPGVCVEVKNCARMELAQWVDEAEVERVNADAEIAACWHKRKGTTDPGRWYVTMTGETFRALLGEYAGVEA